METLVSFIAEGGELLPRKLSRRRGKLSWSGIVGALLSTACHQSGHLHRKRNGLRIHLSMTWCFSTGARRAAAISLEASANTAGQKKEDKLPHQQSSRRVA